MKQNSLYKLAKNLFPLHRSLTGKGVVKTLNIIRKGHLKNLKIKKIKSGKKVFDWKVPEEWEIKDAYVKDNKKKTLINIKKNNLHVVQYSKSVAKVVSKKELFKHLHFSKKLPNAIPYVTSYYKKTWGFCLAYNEFKKIKGNNFYVCINSKFKKNGKMTYGEFFLKGKSKKEILLTTYICHPSMANNEISGISVTTFLAKYFSKRKLYYSLRILFVPETIGSISYINKNLEKLKKNVIAAYNITCVGDDKNYSFINSRFENTLTDRSAEETFNNMRIRFKKYNFLDRGSDERQFNSPNVNIPMAVFTRSKFGTYKQYHTSEDDLNFISPKGLRESFLLIKNTIENIQNKIIPISLNFCEPMMSKRKLYPALSHAPMKKNTKNLMNFISYCDGNNELEYISKKIKLSFKETLKIFKKLKGVKIVNQL
tara:strand:+ start:121 stop:1398 length:1278 start_codon:yes stop_codon:yes gene_type:complete